MKQVLKDCLGLYFFYLRNTTEGVKENDDAALILKIKKINILSYIVPCPCLMFNINQE